MQHNLSDPRHFEALATSLQANLGVDRVKAFVKELSVTNTKPILDVLKGFARVADWVDALKRQEEPPDSQFMLHFAMVASIVKSATHISGSDSFLAKIRNDAWANPDQFYDTLFEGEVAVYWQQKVTRQSDTVRFGPASGNPDLWLKIPSPQRQYSFPTECKRIRPHGKADVELEEFSKELERRFQGLIADVGPIKAIVWTHRQAKPSDVSTVADLLQQAIEKCDQMELWVTIVDEKGDFQISVAQLGGAGEFQSPGPVVTDVPANPVILTRAEVRHGVPGPPLSRLKSILSIQSDFARDRVGNLQARVRQGCNQLTGVDEAVKDGIVAVRIRPPKDLGDLYNTDLVIRGELARIDADHVALVVVFWNEADVTSESLTPDQSDESIMTVAYRLRSYFIQNPRGKVRLGIDSYDEYFGHLSDPVMTDPIDGSLKPVDHDTLAILEGGGNLPEKLRKAVANFRSSDGASDSATIYLRWNQSLGSLSGEQIIGFIPADGSHFRCFIDREHHLRTVEVREATPTRVATIDLRAWAQCKELCFSVAWETEFRVGIWSPDESQRLWINSSPVPVVN